VTPEQREHYEERAAIREYDAGFSREEAERLAREDVQAEVLIAPEAVKESSTGRLQGAHERR
jgi:hypothetical protein